MFPSFPLSTPLCSADTDQTSFSQTLPPCLCARLICRVITIGKIPASERERKGARSVVPPQMITNLVERGNKRKRRKKRMEFPALGQQQSDRNTKEKRLTAIRSNGFLGNCDARLLPIHGWNYGKIRKTRGRFG